MAKYKRRQKVKRYHRSFYSRGTRIKRGIGIVVLVAVVLGAAWLAAPHVLDWATHTWYTVVKNRDLEAESASRAASSEAAASSAAQAASSQAASEPEEPQFDAKAVTDGSWAEVDVSALTDDTSIRAAAQQLKAQGAVYGVVTFKDESGTVYYASQVAAAADGIAENTVDPARIAEIFREEEIIPVAQIAAFKDPISPRTDRSMAIHYNGDALWLDAQKNGNPWLNPYSDAAVEYVGDLVEELRGMGFEQAVLTNVQFPKLTRKQDYGTTNGVSRADQLKADIAALQNRFDGKVTLWFSYTLDQCNDSSVSLDVPALTLGMENLLVTSGSSMDTDAQNALKTAALDAGVKNMAVHTADEFMTAFFE